MSTNLASVESNLPALVVLENSGPAGSRPGTRDSINHLNNWSRCILAQNSKMNQGLVKFENMH